MILHGDCLDLLTKEHVPEVSLVYMDPPFNTGNTQTGRAGLYPDKFPEYCDFLMPRLEAAWSLLKADGSIFVHLDRREVHYVKVAMDKTFGRNRFMNEIIWAYDYGGRTKVNWSHKHDTILWYVKNPQKYTFNYDAIDRVPYMAPGLVGPEKAARGKTPTDVWWNTIVPTNGKERTGYPTQKPIAILNRIIRVHSNPGDTILDPFAGSGTAGVAAAAHGRQYVLIDVSNTAIETMKFRGLT